MKIAIPINGETIDSPIHKSFGRCNKFILVDTISDDFILVENTQNMQAAQGAGIQSAQSVIRVGADVIITIHCGPKAYRVLSEAGVKVYLGINDSIIENLRKLKTNELKEMNNANIESHWV